MNIKPTSAKGTSVEICGSTAHAVVFLNPGQLELSQITLQEPGPDDLLVDVDYSGISTGTERLLWTGKMPPFPGMGYPLVPGYESVGRVRRAGANSVLKTGDHVFIPGANCFGEIRGLFGGTASRLVVPEKRVLKVDAALGERATLLALAATAYHALRPSEDTPLPELIIGHGVLGRLLARLTVALGGSPPTVWETSAARRDNNTNYPVMAPDEDSRMDYSTILDASGDAGILDSLVARLARGGEITLAGFYAQPLSFSFPPAFMREARIRVAAEWQPNDFEAVNRLAHSGELSLDGLITHRTSATDAESGYHTAFNEPECLKMVLDWRGAATC